MGQKIPDSRVYIHRKCKGATKVTDPEFTTLANPWHSPSLMTYCVRCQSHFPLHEFLWEDTDESITATNARIVSQTPPWVRLLLSVRGCLLILVAYLTLGLLLGYLLVLTTNIQTWLGLTIGGVAALLTSGWLYRVIELVLLKKFYGVSDRRLLR